jgi:elongation factor G
MQLFPAERIRNVALVGHGGTGKTTLAEAMLYSAGMIDRQGRVDDGTTTTDFEPEETERGISVSLAVAALEWHDHKINLIDCPGYADFVGDVAAGLAVADLAVFVVSAVEGVEVQTQLAWRMAAERNLPRMIFVNKLDRDRASFDRTLEDLRSSFGAGVAPLELPVGEEHDFCGVADLLTDTAITYVDGMPTTGPIPPEMEVSEHEIHDALIEGIVVADDVLMERYLDGDTPSFGELEAVLAHGVAEASVFPVLCGCASRDIAVDRLLNFICEIGPSPAERPPVAAMVDGQSVELVCGPGEDPVVLVFKTLADPFVGKVSLFKVLSGTVRSDLVLTNPRTHADERLHAPFALRGKEHLAVGEIPAGDIAAVAKLSDTTTGDTLAPKARPVRLPSLEVPEPVLSIAISPKSTGDEDKLMTALRRLQDEDPAIAVRRDDESKQTVLSGMGETHLTVVADRLRRKFGVEVETAPVEVPYRETITTPSSAVGRYKKQTGGHGQFGVAEITIAPAERGAGFTFVDRIVGGAIPRQFIPAVEKGVAEAMEHGGSFGYPVVDVTVTCVDGKYHSVDSSEMSFKMAGALGFREALAKAQPVLLEPISWLEVTVPASSQGDVMGDLNARRGRIQSTEATDGGDHVIRALVPTSELLRYAIDLRSITGGWGRFRAGHDHYDLLPPHLSDAVVRTAPQGGG